MGNGGGILITLEGRFRRVVARVYGARKGAIEEEIKLWLKKYENQV